MKTKEFLKFIIFPLLLFLFFLIFTLVYRILDLPSLDDLVVFARELFGWHLYLTVFVGALVEGLLLINWYLPGSLVIVLGVVFARDTGASVVVTVSLVILAFFITSVVNYALGKYGWYRLLLRFGLREPLERAQTKVEKSGLPVIFSTYFHPNLIFIPTSVHSLQRALAFSNIRSSRLLCTLCSP